MNNLTLNSKHFLGKLCDRKHDWNNTGNSLRYVSINKCVECVKAAIKKQKEKNQQKRKDIRNGEYLKSLSIVERCKHLDLSTECKLTNANACKNGYAYTTSGLYTGTTLHRASLMQYLGLGYVSKTLDACHACNNRLCINPLHIYFGTRSENMQDAVVAGHTNKGSKSTFSALSESQVKEICKLLDRGVSEGKTAKLFKVTTSTIHSIGKGKNWGWLTGRKPKNKKVKCFVAIDPDGLLHYFRSIEIFASENGMTYGGIYNAVKGLRTHYKGWKFYQVFQ